LWQWAGFLGVRPDIEQCSFCGKPISPSSTALYSPFDGEIACNTCAAGKEGLLELCPGSRRWLILVKDLSAAQISRYTLDVTSFSQAKTLATSILAQTFGRRLSSWEW
jgi:recombinational DNA repair protein (RecF pathway)